MIGFLVRRFGWMAFGAGARYVVRRSVGRSLQRSVDLAAAELEDRLPANLARAARALPVDVVRAGGAATVGVRSARQVGGVVGTGARTAGRVGTRIPAGGRLVRRAVQPRSLAAERIRMAADAVSRQADLERRDLSIDFARHNRGVGAGIDAAVDARRRSTDEPLPEVPDPVTPGRWRRRRSLPPAPVARVQRTYRPPIKPWDRPRSGR